MIKCKQHIFVSTKNGIIKWGYKFATCINTLHRKIVASCLAYVMAIAADNILTISWMGQNILPQFLLHNNFKSGHHFSQEGSITKSYQQNQNISCIFQEHHAVD